MTRPLKVSNIKTDFGAVGNGSADDTSVFQSAFNTIWNTIGTGTMLYVPAGRYLITGPLYMMGSPTLGTSQNNFMFGDGMRSSVLVFNPTSSGNTLTGGVDGGAVTGCIIQSGIGHMTMSKFGIQGPGTSGSPVTDINIVGVFSTLTPGVGTTTQNMFIDMAFDDLAGGILGWANANCENYIIRNCYMDHCSFYGARPVGSNTLNWGVFGGCYSEIGALSTTNPAGGVTGDAGGAISIAANGSVEMIKDVRFVNNKVDINNDGSTGLCIVGGSSTSPLFYAFLGGGNNTCVINGFTYRPPTSVIGGTATHFISHDCAAGQTAVYGCRYAPLVDNGVSYITSGAGDIILDALMVRSGGTSGRIKGAPRISMRANNWGSPKNVNLWAEFSGTYSQHIDGD